MPDPGTSTLLVEELFEQEEPRFLDALYGCRAGKWLGAFAARWAADGRPWAHAQLLAYIDDGCDRPGHRVLVKRLFKAAEARGDDLQMARFAVAFDGLLTREVVREERWDWKLQASVPSWGTRWRPQTDPEAFSTATRLYLCRRAFRYFRAIGREDPSRYRSGIVAALVLYPADRFDRPEAVLEAWTFFHALYWDSPGVRRDPRGIHLHAGRTLADLAPAPIFPAAWEGPEALPDLLALLDAPSAAVRAWSLARLRTRRDPLDLDALLPLLASRHDDVQAWSAERLDGLGGFDKLPLARWLALLGCGNPHALPALVRLFEANVAPERVGVERCAELARSQDAPVAALGWRWLRARGPEHAGMVLDAPQPTVRREAAAVVAEALRAEPRPLGVRDLLDARHAEVRAAGLALMEAPSYTGEGVLWSALAESPWPDARDFLVRHLAGRLDALEPSSVERVWATALLSVDRGSRAKRAALRQIADQVVATPERAGALLPLVAVGLRGVRPSERRAALAVLARAAFASPELAAAVKRHVPELVLEPA